MTSGLLPVDFALHYPEAASVLALLAEHGAADVECLLRWVLVPPRRLAALRALGHPSCHVRFVANVLIHQRLEITKVVWFPRSRRFAYLCDLLYAFGDGRIPPPKS